MKRETFAQRQVRLEREKQLKGDQLGHWDKISLRHLYIDQNGHDAEVIVALVDEALGVEDCPAIELQEIRVQARTAILAFDRVRNTPKGKPKGRKEAEEIYRRANSLIDQLSDRIGFDLWEKETWTKRDTPNTQQ